MCVHTLYVQYTVWLVLGLRLNLHNTNQRWSNEFTHFGSFQLMYVHIFFSNV